MPNKEEKRITEQSSLYEHLEKMSVDELTAHINAENPQRLWRIKQNRQKNAIEQKRLQLESQDYKTVLETKERVTKKQTKKRGIL